MSAINLIPADRLEERAVKACMRAWSVRLVIVALLGVAALVIGRRHVSDRQGEAASLEAEFIQCQDRVVVAERVLDARDQLVELRRSITAIQVRHPIVTTFDAFARSLPPRTSLSYLQLVHQDPTDDEERTVRPGVVLRGLAPDHAEVGTLLRGLETAGRFDDVQLVRLTERTDGARHRVEFEVSAHLKSGGAG